MLLAGTAAVAINNHNIRVSVRIKNMQVLQATYVEVILQQ